MRDRGGARTEYGPLRERIRKGRMPGGTLERWIKAVVRWVARMVLRGRSATAGEEKEDCPPAPRVNMVGVIHGPPKVAENLLHPLNEHSRVLEVEAERAKHLHEVHRRHHNVQPDFLATAAGTQATHPPPIRAETVTTVQTPPA